MAKLRPYLALDIETTGLDTEKSQILQLGWVIDDGVSPKENLERGSILIVNDQITYGENYALGMNAWIFQELMKPQAERKYPSETLANGLAKLFLAVEKTADLAEKFDKENGEKRPSKRIQLAGKNVANFDWPIILNNAKSTTVPNCIGSPLDMDFWLRTFLDHRFIDCGAIFFEQFGRNPGFAAINKLIGWKDINHDALDDATNVVVAIRYRVGITI